MDRCVFMAKRNNELISGVDKAKVRVFFAEVEGNNESIQEALKTMVSAMSRPVRLISDQGVNGKATVLPPQGDIQETDDADGQVGQAEAIEEESGPPSARKPRGSGKKVDRNAGLILVPDLNFMSDGKQALKAFLDEKSPKSDIEVTLAAVYYMQHVMVLTKIGPSHVMTALKAVGMAIPASVRQTIRNVKKTRMWLNYNDIEDVRTTTQGVNFVEHEMGKSE